MSWLTTMWARLRFFFLRRPAAELDEELQFHLERSIAAYVADGLTPLAARRQAFIDFGGVEGAREQAYAQRPGWLLETVVQDIRYALRGFARNRAFTLTVLMTLMLAIGATTAVFSVVDRILFRALPYVHDDRLVSIGLTQSLEKQEFMVGGFFYDWRDNQRPFEAMASQGTGPHTCTLAEANPEQLNCITFQAGFLPMLGVVPVIGRNFLLEEDLPNGPQVALITYGLWKSHFGLDRGILNRILKIDGDSVRVIGVLPKDFEMPTLQAADVITPLALAEAKQQRGMNGGIGQPMRVFARLKPGVSIQQAYAAMGPLFLHTQQTFIPEPLRKDFHLSIRSLRDRQTQDAQLTAWVLLGSVFAVLLIACANVASLMMARGAARERERAVRAALGASRGRLIRQTMTEALLLAFAGAGLGQGLAEGLLRVFIAMAPESVPFLDRAGLDWRIVSFTLSLALVCALCFGLVPALQQPHSLALATRTMRTGGHAMLRRSLVIGQIAMSMILLSGAGLLLRSFRNMEEQNLGLRTGGVLVVSISLPGIVSRKGQKEMEFSLRAEAAVRRLPGVEAVGWSDSLPPGGGWQDGRRFSDLAVEGKARPEQGIGGTIGLRGVTPDYFHALDIRIARGQNFTEAQRSANEDRAIVSRQLAAWLFGNEDPIGKRIHMGSDGVYTVSGVAENVRNGGLTEQDQPEMYWLRRNEGDQWGVPVPVMIVQSALSPTTLIPWIRAQIAQIDPTLPVEFGTLNERVSKLADRPRFETALLGFFALMGLVMAVIGLYGVISFLATQRTQEIGVRMALGANRANILGLIAGEGLRLVCWGGAAGLVASLTLTQLLKSLLFNVGPRDPMTLAAVALLLAAVALLATLIPARAAMRVDPMAALRCE